MSQQVVGGFQPEWRSYRCPVCGHVDEADMTGATGQVVCSHCATELELETRAPDAEAASVKVAVRRRFVH